MKRLRKMLLLSLMVVGLSIATGGLSNACPTDPNNPPPGAAYLDTSNSQTVCTTDPDSAPLCGKIPKGNSGSAQAAAPPVSDIKGPAAKGVKGPALVKTRDSSERVTKGNLDAMKRIIRARISERQPLLRRPVPPRDAHVTQPHPIKHITRARISRPQPGLSHAVPLTRAHVKKPGSIKHITRARISGLQARHLHGIGPAHVRK
jgi:hypothetical protein